MSPKIASSRPTPTVSPQEWPRHIAIIMDGNNRWAKSRLMPRKLGHKQGAEALKKLIQNCADSSLRYLTVYAFSSENWQRPADEVDDLMSLMRYYLKNEVESLHEHNIRLAFIGDRERLQPDICAELNRVEDLTAQNDRMTLIIALSYGAREELVRATQKLAKQAAAGEIKAEEINESMLEGALDTGDFPHPDLLIRTGGDQRLSNFLLWQAAYSELYFCETLWPDFTVETLQNAIEDYAKRERRFGKRTEQAEEEA